MTALKKIKRGTGDLPSTQRMADLIFPGQAFLKQEFVPRKTRHNPFLTVHPFRTKRKKKRVPFNKNSLSHVKSNPWHIDPINSLECHLLPEVFYFCLVCYLFVLFICVYAREEELWDPLKANNT